MAARQDLPDSLIRAPGRLGRILWDTKLRGHSDEIRKRASRHFSHDPAAMNLQGYLRYA